MPPTNPTQPAVVFFSFFSDLFFFRFRLVHAQAQRELTWKFLVWEANHECFLDVVHLEEEMHELGYVDLNDLMTEVLQFVHVI